MFKFIFTILLVLIIISNDFKESIGNAAVVVRTKRNEDSLILIEPKTNSDFINNGISFEEQVQMNSKKIILKANGLPGTPGSPGVPGAPGAPGSTGIIIQMNRILKILNFFKIGGIGGNGNNGTAGTNGGTTGGDAGNGNILLLLLYQILA